MTLFTKAARIVGDLDDDFYRDERQRDVWNEASAVGFQFFQWTALAEAAVLPWVAGDVGAWVGLGILITWFVTSMVALAYAKACDVDLYASAKLLRPRTVAAIVLYLVGLVGIYAHLGAPIEQDASTWAGRVTGGLVGAGGAIAAIAWSRQRTRRREEEAEALDAEDL
jgi:hypothetical protein